MIDNIATLPLKGTFGYVFRRGVIRIKYRLLKKLGVRSKSIQVDGNLHTVNVQDYEQLHLAEDLVREPENVAVFDALKSAGFSTRFVDIGANCGHLALQVRGIFDETVLVEPNPGLCVLLNAMFENESTISLIETAVVENDCEEDTVVLRTPEGSSALGSIVEVDDSEGYDQFEVKATKIGDLLSKYGSAETYFKIDIEGLEYRIIKSGIEKINSSRLVVGFEALSFEYAKKCAELFSGYRFYCARFNFLEPSGSLYDNLPKVLVRISKGAGFEVCQLDFNDRNGVRLDNYSQVMAIPEERAREFEVAIKSQFGKRNFCNLVSCKSWSH